MSYTREQRAANAAKAAERAARQAEQADRHAQGIPEPSPEPAAEPQTETRRDDDVITRVQLKNEPRDRAYEELEERNRRRAEEMTGEKAEPAPETTPDPPPAAEPAAPAPAPEPVAAAPAPAPAVEMVTVKVDGESFEAPKAEVEEAGGIRAYQTMRAADNRLKKANEALAATRQTQEYFANLARNIQQPPPPPEPTDDELIQAIRFGTPQEASAALAKVSARGRGAQVNPTEIVMQSTAMANYNAAKRKFGTEFADITSNPIVKASADALENQRVRGFAQNGQVNWSNLANLDFDDFFRRIGNEVRGAFGQRQSQPASAPATPAAPTASPPSQPSDKETRKLSIVNPPSAAARAALPEEDNPGTPEEQHRAAIAEAKKARGQPTG